MRRFRIQVLIRSLVFAALLLGCIFLYIERFPFLISLAAGLSALGTLILLIRYVERSSRDVSRFLASIHHADFTERFIPEKGHPFPELVDSFEEIVEKIRSVRIEREEHYRYLQTVVEQVGIGVLSYDVLGKVDLANSTFLNWFGLPFLKSLGELDQKQPGLAGRLSALRSGDITRIRIDRPDSEISELSVQVTTFKLRSELRFLLVFQNIKNELDEKEMEAWQSLTRVLTHEIMNSITPISTLSATLQTLVQNQPHANGVHEITDEVWEDISGALATIQKRSEGLISFVHEYRSFSKLRRPEVASVVLADFLGGIERLFGPECARSGILLRYQAPPAGFTVQCDIRLIEQVIINLIRNAMEALADRENAVIELSADRDDRGGTRILVSDNGPGISAAAMDKIFIPFFTTKPGGSGIGLSLSRQIMRLHGGTLTVSSMPEQNTTFTLRFSK